MHVITLRVGYGCNCYIVEDEHTKDAVVIDPGAQGRRISNTLTQNGLTLRGIFLTHGHFDHVTGVKELLQLREEQPKIWISRSETEQTVFPYKPELLSDLPMCYWEDNETVAAGSMLFRILLTPGHSPGSVCILIQDMLFSGDTLLQNAVGRTDFPGSDPAAMERSLLRLAELGNNYRILPGHDAPSTLFEELRCNPYLRRCTEN